MKVFWRDEPLNAAEIELYGLVLKAHYESAFRGNISGQAVGMAAVGSGDYFNAIAAGLLTLGGMHGPVEESFYLLTLDNISAGVAAKLMYDQKVPGWGNSFVKGEPDKIWIEVDQCLERDFPLIHAKLKLVTDRLHFKGIMIHPNPSAYTAAAAIVLRISKDISGYLLIAGRLAAWTLIAKEHLKAK